MASLFKRIWALVAKPTRFVGRDLEGNAFFEYPSVSEDPRRTKRVVEYRPADRKWDYIGGNKRLPVQWTQWLTHTRHDPPNLEELQADLQRRHHIKNSALLLEEGYKAERAANKLIPETTSPEAVGGSTPPPAVESGVHATAKRDFPIAESRSAEPTKKKERMLTPPINPLPPPETESWSPKVSRRGQK